MHYINFGMPAESGLSYGEYTEPDVYPLDSVGVSNAVLPGAKSGSESIVSQKATPPEAATLDVSPQATYSVLEFTESDIKQATNNFSANSVLGSGGFGVVYKGKMRGTNIAVKKLTEVYKSFTYFSHAK